MDFFLFWVNLSNSHHEYSLFTGQRGVDKMDKAPFPDWKDPLTFIPDFSDSQGLDWRNYRISAAGNGEYKEK
jgi:hypothetical protein